MDKSTVPIVDEIRSLIKETQENLKEASASHKREMKEIRDSHKKLSALSAEAKQEAKREMKEIRDSHKKLSALSEEAKREMEELRASQKATDRQIEATDRQIQKIGGRFNQRWGALVESLVEGNLVRIFQDRGIDITQTHTRSQSEWKKPDGRVERREFDIIVANGTEVVVVEVKTTLTPKDVNVFLETLVDFRNYFPRYKSETIYGAVAYLSSENKANMLAEEEGLFLIRATGDSAGIANKKDFKPKSFS